MLHNLSLLYHPPHCATFLFFNDTATTEIYTLSLHDALPICAVELELVAQGDADLVEQLRVVRGDFLPGVQKGADAVRSEEHTSELQSRQYLVCRLLLEKKKIGPQLHVVSPFSTPSTTPRPRQ